MISVRLRGTEKSTPSRPPKPMIVNTHHPGKWSQWPRITSAGIVNTVPAAIEEPAEAPVATMLFSRMLLRPRSLSTPIDTTAAGIAVATVRPAKRPR